MLLQRALPCTSQVSRSRAPHGRLSTAAARTTYSGAPPQQSSDVVAGLMRAAMELSLKRRLQGYESVNCNVAVDVATLLDGRFAALQIDGLGWTTPLGMTARRLKVCAHTTITQMLTSLDSRSLTRARTTAVVAAAVVAAAVGRSSSRRSTAAAPCRRTTTGGHR